MSSILLSINIEPNIHFKPQKKMKKIILILHLIVSVYSLNSNNYCLIDNKKDNCISYYDDNNNNYITKCSNSDCNGEYKLNH